MDKRTAEALEASIKHWQENVAAKSVDEVNITGRACALCRVSREPALGQSQTDEQINCVGCPVKERTGYSSCRHTPYSLVEDEYAHNMGCEDGNEEDKEALNNLRAAMQKELDFLISLRRPAKAVTL